MLIALEKKKTNIAEYILYMWQIEDTIRAFSLDLALIDKNIISQFKQDEPVLNQIRNWYAKLIDTMRNEKIEISGHMSFIKREIEKLEKLHLSLLETKDEGYDGLFKEAVPLLSELRAKQKEQSGISDVELALQTLYLFLLLKLNKQVVSGHTEDAIELLSKMLAYLAKQYHQVY